MPRVGFRHSEYSRQLMQRAQRSNRPSLSERFHDRYEFDPFGGCWLWTGAMVMTTGYGTIQFHGRTLQAHRVSFELHHRPLKRGEFVLHKCDVPACVNPRHLRAGSPRDNVRDMIVKGRRRCVIGDRHVGAKLREQDIPAIRGRLLAGHSCKKIADDYGVTDCAINAIRRGKSWTHVTGLPNVRVSGVRFHDDSSTPHSGQVLKAGDREAEQSASRREPGA